MLPLAASNVLINTMYLLMIYIYIFLQRLFADNRVTALQKYLILYARCDYTLEINCMIDYRDSNTRSLGYCVFGCLGYF